jgi:hypothetical protein
MPGSWLSGRRRSCIFRERAERCPRYTLQGHNDLPEHRGVLYAQPGITPRAGAVINVWHVGSRLFDFRIP